MNRLNSENNDLIMRELAFFGQPKSKTEPPPLTLFQELKLFERVNFSGLKIFQNS